MERLLTTMRSFFENPNKEFGIREISRISKINHTTIRNHLNKLVEEGYLYRSKGRLYPTYGLVLDKKTLNLKLFFNLEKIRRSNIIEDLEQYYDLPVIVLFGSYASATDDESSDVDLCVITNIEKEFKPEKYEKLLKRRVDIHKYSRNAWEKAKSSNPDMVNSICNGIPLSGELEVM